MWFSETLFVTALNERVVGFELLLPLGQAGHDNGQGGAAGRNIRAGWARRP